jgi:hypothetical protein
MIKLIGLRRIIMLAVLLGINLLAASFYFLTLSPILEDAQAQLNAVDSQISGLHGKITEARQDMIFVKENLSKYQELQDKGLFMEQDRFMIDRLLQDMRGKAGLSAFSFTIEDLKDVPNANAESMGSKLVSSRINVEKIASPLDSNIYVFLQNIADAFPEHTAIRKFEIKRVAGVNEQALRDIYDGKPVSFVTADISFDWMTLASKAAEQSPNAAGIGGH